MGRNDLAAQVENRIQNLEEALQSLPFEYSPEAYSLWKDLSRRLRGLYDIRRRFLLPPPPEEDSSWEEILY